MGALHMARIGELDVGQDLEFEKRWWKIERTGWAVIALVLLAALLGFLGPGPLTKKTAGMRNGPLWLEYYRFQRYQAPVELRVNVGAGAAKDNHLGLWINQQYIEAIQIHHVDPEPESVELAGQRFVYTFKAAELSAAGKIVFHFKPTTFGKTSVQIGLVNGGEIGFTQFFYP
jgi:hypothetical protein